MKTVIAAVISIAFLMGAPVFLMEKQQSAFAISDYRSGWKHGVSDGKIDPRVNCPGLSDKCNWYILEPGKGFKFHSWDFVRGYVLGWCSVNAPHTGFDADEAEFDCDKGPTSASWLIK